MKKLFAIAFLLVPSVLFAANVDTLYSKYQKGGNNQGHYAQQLIQIFIDEEYYNHAIDPRFKEDRKNAHMLVSLGMANHYYMKSMFPESIKCGKTAENAVPKDSLRWFSECYEILNVAYQRTGDFSLALQYAQKDLNIGKELKDKKIQSSALNSLAAIYYATEHMDEALLYINQAIDLERDNHSDQGKALAIRLGIKCEILANMHRNEEALECINEALELDRKANRTEKVGIRLSQKADILISLKQWKQCKDICLQALQIFEKTHNTIDRIITLKQLGICETELNEFNEAERHLLEGEQLCKDINFKPLLWRIQNHLYLLYKKTYDLNRALFYLENSSRNKDSLNKEEYKKLVSEYQVKYENSETEQELELQKVKLHNRNYVIFALTSVMALILTIAISLYFLARARKKRNIELTNLSAQRDRIFSIVSHDLKNPVASQKQVLNFICDHYDQIDDVTKKQQLTALKQSNESLSELLINLLEWASWESGRLPFKPIRIDLNSVARNSIRLVEGQAKKKNITIEQNIQENNFINSDINFVETILRNLLSNAIKFSYPDSSVEISCFESAQEKILSVSDHGVGLTPEQINTIFTLRGKSTLGTGGEKGSGIGMVVCQELAEKAHGKLTVTSEKNKGSTFSLHLPKNPDSAQRIFKHKTK